MTAPELLLRRVFEPAALLAAHPPRLRHKHKRLVFALACPPGSLQGGPVEVTRWKATPLPADLPTKEPRVVEVRGHYDYAGPSEAVWHVNFADPCLFVAYGSALLAQDELQAAEHPLLGSISEALSADGHAKTEEPIGPTPVLVANVERRVAIETRPTPERPLGLYGNRFGAASEADVRSAVRVLSPPTITNLIAIAAPTGRPGPYWRGQIETILITATTGFLAARVESERRWPGRPIEVRTGFWGCGAFGGSRRAMAMMQLLAARLAGIDTVRFYTFDADGSAHLDAAQADLELVTAPATSMADRIERIEDFDYEWGISDGN